MTNSVIRKEIAKSRFKFYQIAEKMGISHITLSVMLRKELNEQLLTRVRTAIVELLGDEEEIHRVQNMLDNRGLKNECKTAY